MRRLTNLHVLSAVLIALLLVGLAIFMHPFDSTVKQLTFYILVIAIGGLAAAIASNLQRTLKDKNSIWLKPISSRAGTILINSTVSVWLCVVGLILFIAAKEKGTADRRVVVIVLLFVGVGFGWYLQKRLSSNTLLPYGISFFGVLIIILAMLAIASA
jgi:4-amino-4-deoxy-L-arabinose transferase-like glycosyltransferase